MKKHTPAPHESKDGLHPSSLGPSAAEMEGLVGLFNSGQLGAAEAEARRLIEKHTGTAVLHNILGSALMGQGRVDEAVTSFGRALGIDPNNFHAHNNLGNALAMQDKFGEAAASYRRALAINPDFAQAYNNLGNALRELGTLDEAIASFQRALDLRPAIVQTHVNLGTALAAQGKFPEAAESFRRAIEIKPDFAEAHNNLGNALKHLGRLDEAVTSFRQALAYKPDGADTLYNLHALLLDKEDMSAAVSCLQRAVSLEPRNLRYKFFLGMVLEYSGDSRAAGACFREVEQGTDLDRASLDAWRYIKSAGPRMPLMIGSHLEAFRLGLEYARDEGLVLEFGVRFGASIRQIAALAQQQVHGFDSFEGLPEAWHREEKGTYTTGGIVPQVPDNVVLHKGWFEDTLPQFVKLHKEPVRFMNIDCDLYSATRTVLDTFAPHIGSGAVIVFDEYLGNKHWREDEFKAFQEAVHANGWTYEYLAFSLFTKQAVVRIL